MLHKAAEDAIIYRKECVSDSRSQISGHFFLVTIADKCVWLYMVNKYIVNCDLNHNDDNIVGREFLLFFFPH